jgi:hypothetical protein
MSKIAADISPKRSLRRGREAEKSPRNRLENEIISNAYPAFFQLNSQAQSPFFRKIRGQLKALDGERE